MTTLPQGTNMTLPHLLVVDDEHAILQMLALVLQNAGYRVSCANNTAEAFSLLMQEACDAILTDVMMPDEDGISFLGRVHQSWPELPVIVMTGHAQLQMAIDAIKNGAFDFINKPIDFVYLCKIIERAVKYSTLQRIEKNYRAELEETVTRRTAELTNAMFELDFARSALLKGAIEKSEFMSTISHEMRTPMNGIVGALDLLGDTGFCGAQAEYLSMARQSADNMVALIDQLLTFSSVSSQASAARYDLIDLSVVLNTLVAENQPNFAKKNIFLTLQIATDVPKKIWTDKEHFKRLFSILIGNALKFTDRGGVTLDVTRMESDDKGELLHFTVADSGIGIPDGMLERIFEPFVQGDGSFTRRHGGTGLGLAIARQNALLLDGTLWAEHIPGGGSEFKLSMKVVTP